MNEPPGARVHGGGNPRDNQQVTASSDRTRRMTVTTFASLADHDRADAAYWRALPVDVRVSETWRLSEEQWRLRGEYPDESGFCRSLARVVRA
jgi:hypothetical protein